MRIQCSCGAKHNIEVTPDMAQGPVHFVCSACGLDASEYVTTLVHRELAFAGIPIPPQPVPAGLSNIAPAPPGYAPAAPAPVAAAIPIPRAIPAAAPAAAAATAASPGRLRIHVAAPAQPAPTEAQPAETETGEFPRCLKHGGEAAMERCYVCSKPICPKCMALFGYVCSPLCKNKAEAQGIQLPVYEGQNSIIQAKQRQKNLYIISGAAAFVVSLLGFWIWYAFIGSTPHTVYSVRFTESASSGQSALAGKNQLIFLHGATLARHDLKGKKEVWTRYLVDKGELEKEIAEAINENKAAIDKANSSNPDTVPSPVNPSELRRNIEHGIAAGLQLRVVGSNIWVIAPNKLTLFDWESGQPAQEIALTNNYGTVLHRGDEVVVLSGESDKQHATYINLASKETREEDITGLPKSAAAKVDIAKTGKAGSKGGGLPGMSGKDAGGPLDPQKVAQQAQKLSTPGKIALPAVLSSSIHNRKTLDALNDGPDTPRTTTAGARQSPEEPFLLIPTPDGFMRFTSKLLQEIIVTRQAMKAPPAKSALNGPINVTQTAAVANEILNELQRSAGGDTVEEDESRYLVKLSSADGKNEWSSEVIGPPRLHPLKTVNVLSMNKKIMVFDKQNKKLWEAPLTYNVGGHELEDLGLNSGVGQGPCVERNNRLYVFDDGVLTAFDLATGNAVWRVPSVGITGLFFDDKDMLYVNTTDASPETIKYSRQIDISQMPSGQLLKIDPQDGKVVFKVSPPGPVTYVSGKFIYCVQSSGPGSDDDSMDSVMNLPGIGGMKPFIRIKRLSPSNGKEMWEHYESRGPLDVQFDKNTIRLIFKKEVEVLKFLSL